MLIERLDSFSHFWTKLTATLSAVRHVLTLIVISLCRSVTVWVNMSRRYENTYKIIERVEKCL